MVRLLSLLSLSLLLGGCTTLRGQADELARKGRFVEAAAIYDELVAKSPHEKELVVERDGLRGRALDQLLGTARRLRMEGQDEKAEDHLRDFLDRRVAWNAKLSGGLESSLLEEMGGTDQHLRRIISEPASRGLALTAEAALARKRPLLAHGEMVHIRNRMEDAVLQSGRDTCERLKGVSSETGSHWRELVARYCHHWGGFAPEPPPGPELTRAPDFTGTVAGLDSAQLELLRGQLTRAYEKSPWFSSSATTAPELSLAGSFSARRDSHTVELTAPYYEKVPYTDHEDRTETIEEPYEVEEEYTDKDGNKKTRKVTHVRKYTRTFTVPVTRYRDVARTFEYRALRRSVDYQLTLSSSGVLDTRRGPLSTVVQGHYSESGYEHDVRFDPGDVRPQRAVFSAPDDWVAQRVQAMAATFAQQLVEHWRQSYCEPSILSLDAAARCARAGTELPTPAYRVLSEILGDDAAHVPSLFVAR